MSRWPSDENYVSAAAAPAGRASATVGPFARPIAPPNDAVHDPVAFGDIVGRWVMSASHEGDMRSRHEHDPVVRRQ